MKFLSQFLHAVQRVDNQPFPVQPRSAPNKFRYFSINKRIRSDRKRSERILLPVYPFYPKQVHFTPDSPPAHQASSRVNSHSTHKCPEANLPHIRQYPANDPYQTPVHSSKLPYPHPG